MLDDKHLEYVDLLEKWNKAYNLTAVRERDAIITHHIEDSLSLLPYLDGVHSVLDVGTGPGLPGIPLAIERPDISFKLLDSQRKKITFVQHAVSTLGLSNVEVMHTRVEALQNMPPVDMVVSRAFASLSEFVQLISSITNSKTQIIAMKGRYEQVLEEVEQLPADFKLLNIEKVTVPGVDAERCLVFLSKQEDDQ